MTSALALPKKAAAEAATANAQTDLSFERHISSFLPSEVLKHLARNCFSGLTQARTSGGTTHQWFQFTLPNLPLTKFGRAAKTLKSLSAQFCPAIRKLQ
jgi:hypothetical protein